MNKNQILDTCFSILDQKMQDVKVAIHDSNSSLQEDTKSSAGDKYETSREMIQQDLNRYEQQLHVLKQDIELLERIRIQKTENVKVGLGSLVKTDKAVYFLATSVGLITIDNQKIFCVSLASPIGKVLLGLAIGDTFEFNGAKQEIINFL